MMTLEEAMTPQNPFCGCDDCEAIRICAAKIVSLRAELAAVRAAAVDMVREYFSNDPSNAGSLDRTARALKAALSGGGE